MEKETIELVKKMIEDGNLSQEIAEKYCPELKESKDERIRKELIEYIKDQQSSFIFAPDCRDKYEEEWNNKYNSWIAWLEKQGKDNMGISEATKQELEDNLNKALEKETPESCNEFLDDKVESKFNVGNWYQCTKDFFGKGVTFDKNTAYYCAKEGCLQDEYGCHIAIVKDLYDNFKLWTVQDAKGGDVLVTLHYILVFKEFLKNDGGISYCHYDFGAGNPQFVWFEDKNWYFGKEAIIHPATKEQRDTLKRAMTDAGYTFDFEKKELKKIEQKPIIAILKFRVGDTIKNKKTNKIFTVSGYSLLYEYYHDINHYHEIKFSEQDDWELVEQNHAWSEEDETKIKSIIALLKSPALCAMDGNKGIIDENIKYLKSLRDRVQPQQEWSEEEQQIIEEAACIILDCVNTAETEIEGKRLRELADKLQDLRPH